MLSQIAQDFAAEISAHDWSDAPYRADRAGHDRSIDGARRSEKQLSPMETEVVVVNVMWVVAQQLASVDPNFNVHEFAAACGVAPRFRLRSDGSPSGAIPGGLRPWDFRVERDAGR